MARYSTLSLLSFVLFIACYGKTCHAQTYQFSQDFNKQQAVPDPKKACLGLSFYSGVPITNSTFLFRNNDLSNYQAITGKVTSCTCSTLDKTHPAHWTAVLQTTGGAGKFTGATGTLNITNGKFDFYNNFNSFHVSGKIVVPDDCPDLSSTYDLAAYVDTHNGQVDFCIRDCSKYAANKHGNDNFWFSSHDNAGHSYLEINSLGKYNNSASVAVNILDKNIDKVFPGGATEEDALVTVIEKGHKYKLHVPYVSTLTFNLVLAEVECVEASSYHFTFQVTPHHLLLGTALHGVFKDKCGELWMFQQGRGVPNESWPSYKGAPFGAYWLSMWEDMANNLKHRLGN